MAPPQRLSNACAMDLFLQTGSYLLTPLHWKGTFPAGVTNHISHCCCTSTFDQSCIHFVKSCSSSWTDILGSHVVKNKKSQQLVPQQIKQGKQVQCTPILSPANVVYYLSTHTLCLDSTGQGLVWYQIKFAFWALLPHPNGSMTALCHLLCAQLQNRKAFSVSEQVEGSLEGADNPIACESRASSAPTE